MMIGAFLVGKGVKAIVLVLLLVHVYIFVYEDVTNNTKKVEEEQMEEVESKEEDLVE